MWASFNEIGRVEIAAQLTVEFLLQNIAAGHLKAAELQNTQIRQMSTILYTCP